MSQTFVSNQTIFIFSSADANLMLISLLFLLNANVKIGITLTDGVPSTCSARRTPSSAVHVCPSQMLESVFLLKCYKIKNKQTNKIKAVLFSVLLNNERGSRFLPLNRWLMWSLQQHWLWINSDESNGLYFCFPDSALSCEVPRCGSLHRHQHAAIPQNNPVTMKRTGDNQRSLSSSSLCFYISSLQSFTPSFMSKRRRIQSSDVQHWAVKR